MSYILDALSKSQKQRERGVVPTLMTDFPPQGRKPRAAKYWLTAAIGLLSISVLMTGYALSGRAPNPHSSSEAIAKIPVPSPSPASPSVPPVSAGTDAPPVTLPAKQSRNVQNEFWPSSVDDTNPAENPAPRRQKLVSASAVIAAPESPNSEVPDARLTPATQWLIGELSTLEQTSRSVKSRAQAPPTTARSEGHSTLAYAATDTSPRQQLPVVPSSPARSGNEVPALREMPRETRDSLPPMEINVHSYVESPEKRMVIINMKRYGEGDRMLEGPTIEAITQTGIVLVHEKQRFHLPLR